MKTTVDIDETLLVTAKKRAAELHCPLRRLIQDGLRERVSPKRAAGRVREPRVKWVTVAGGVPKEAHIESREAMHEWIRS